MEIRDIALGLSVFVAVLAAFTALTVNRRLHANAEMWREIATSMAIKAEEYKRIAKDAVERSGSADYLHVSKLRSRVNEVRGL